MKPFDDCEDPIVGISLSGAHPKTSHVNSEKTPPFCNHQNNTTLCLCFVNSKSRENSKPFEWYCRAFQKWMKNSIFQSLLLVVLIIKKID